MFKKLKQQKINEEQSPQRNVQSSQQAQMSIGKKRGQSPSLHQDAPASPSERELLAGMIAEPAFLSEYTIFALDHSKRPKAAQVPTADTAKGVGSSPRGSVNGDGAASPLREESQTLAQKLQQRVSSVETLFRGSGLAEGLFRSSSRESLVHSSSRESLTTLGESEAPSSQAFDPPSDIESEAEDAPGNADGLTKEHLLHRLQRVEKSLTNYRGKYSELVMAYRTVQKEKEKTQAILSQSQDKALRRIGELREELQMDQQAKKHLQEEFDATLEEKDQMITVLQTQVAVMKKRLQAIPGALVSNEGEVSQPAGATDMTTDSQNPPQGNSPEQNEAEGSGEPGSAVAMEVLQKRVHRQETLLQRCKEIIRNNKECSAQLSSENEALQQQLQERLQELEKMKELHTTEKTKLITQLRDAKNLIEQLEQDKGMVIAETKRQMHETLEMKEEEIAQLRSRIQQTVAQKEELQEQREKAEKAAFEELERALVMAQRAEEARRQQQVHMEEQLKQVEQASEDERRSLQQELTRVQQEVITIMKKASEDRIAEMEWLHSEALANKDKEISAQINKAVDRCREELFRAAQEKDQQASLALEEEQLQKAALQTEADARTKELLLELESSRTRILELESSLVQFPQEEMSRSDKLSTDSEEQRKKYESEIAALTERHQKELDSVKSELTETLNKQHLTAIEQLAQKHKSETDVILKDKEIQFHAHIEDMNHKTLDKLEVKQTELEALSSELSEMQKCKQQLEEKLAAVEGASYSARQNFAMRLKEEEMKHQTELENIKCQQTMELEAKDKELEEHILRVGILEEDGKKARQGLEGKLKEMEDVRSAAQYEKEALADASVQLKTLESELAKSKSELKDLEMLLEACRNECQEKADCLQQKTNENAELHHRMQQVMNDQSEKDSSHAETCKSMQEEQNQLKRQMEDHKSSSEIRIENLKKELKSSEAKTEKVKQKAKEMQERFKKRLNEQEETAKAELARKDKELQEKDQQLKAKILEMARANSEGLSSAVSDLEENHKEQLRKLQEVQQQEQENLLRHWQEKLHHQEEEIQEKHLLSLQEKVQELGSLSQQLLTSTEEKEQVLQEMKTLREELAMREATVHKLQEELREAAVKLESLSEGEDILKKQMETVEKNLNQALNERNLFQDQLRKAEEMNKERLQVLSEELEDTCQKLDVLKASRCKEGEDLQRSLEEKVSELQTKEKDLHTQIGAISKEVMQHCQDAQALLNVFSDDLCNKVEAKVIEMQNRVTYNQKNVSYLRNVILTKNDKICTLEKELLQTIEESQNLKSSLDQTVLQLNVNSENLKALTVEKESLQKDAENYSQVLSEKVLCIEKLDEENKNISEKLSANILRISNLESIIEDLKTQLASSITKKDEAVSLLNQQHTEEKLSLKCQMEEAVQRAETEKSLALEEVNTLRNKLTEIKKKVDSKFAQNHTTIKSLQSKVEDMGKQIAEKDEYVQKLTASIDNQSISKSEVDQVLTEKEQRVSALTLELENCTKRVSELEDELKLQKMGREQLVSELEQHRSLKESEKNVLIQQLQQAHEKFSQRNDLVQETEEKLKALEEDIQNARRQLESQQEDFEREKIEILKAKEEALKAAEESAAKVAELKKKAEHKISLIRKQLTSQIEEKEQTIQDIQMQLKDIKQRQDEREIQIKFLEDNGKIMEDVINNLKEEHTKHLEQVQHDERLKRENSLHTLKGTYEEKLAALYKEASINNELAAAGREREEKALSSLRDLETQLNKSEEQNSTNQAEITCLKEELLKQVTLIEELQETCLSLQVQIKEMETNAIQREECSVEQNVNILGLEPLRSVVLEEIDTNMKQVDWKNEKDLLVKEYEMKLQDLNRTLEEKEDQLKGLETAQKRHETDGECLIDGSKSSESHLQKKLTEVEKEKHKVQKDYSQLQKDLRSLRKEHEKELEYLKTELLEENEKKLKLEVEDMEMKHNSALKQLMREFNTQMALKEKELEASVKEVIEKAQSVEAELMESNREETSQLQKIIAQKEDDLNRTVQRYEQVLQSREEEMGTRVWEVQKELEELQQSSLSSPQSMKELQVQLAKKTTELSDARLKEQEYQEKIHTLEDKMRSTFKKTMVTHLGSPYRESSHYSADPLSEPTEFEYLRKVMFEYMMGRETKTMAKVITSMLKFPPDKAQKVLDREDSRVMPWLR